MKKEQNLKEEWLENKAIFTDDSLLIKGYQVMQKWEVPYMKELAGIATSNGGHVLELGFGLGISAGFIQQSPKIKKHTIIEAHPDVVKYAFRLYPKPLKSRRMNILQGFWEDVTPMLKDGIFDGILFDTSPLEQETVFFHFFPFFQEGSRLLKKGGIFTYFSDEAKEISSKHMQLLRQAGFNKIDFKLCRVHPPKSCRYWNHNTIVTPMVHK